MRKTRLHYHKSANRSGPVGSGFGDVREAVNIEDAARAVNMINAKTKRLDAVERRVQREDYARRRITLSPVLDAWLKKEIP